MMKTSIVLLTVLLAVPRVAVAQKPEITPGSRVQVVTASNGTVFGTLVSIDAASLVVTTEQPGVQRVLTRDAIQQVSVGHHRTRGKAVLVGVLAGLTSAVIAGYALGTDRKGEGYVPVFDTTVFVSLLTVPTGAVAGFLVGPGQEHWTPVALRHTTSAAISLTPAASLHSIGFNGSVRW